MKNGVEEALPSWLSFDEENRTLSGIIPIGLNDVYELWFEISDEYGKYLIDKLIIEPVRNLDFQKSYIVKAGNKINFQI